MNEGPKLLPSCGFCHPQGLFSQRMSKRRVGKPYLLTKSTNLEGTFVLPHTHHWCVLMGKNELHGPVRCQLVREIENRLQQ